MNLKEPNYVPLVRICAIKEKEVPYGTMHINTPEMVAELVRNLIRHADREYLLVISVDAKAKPVGIEMVSIGTISEIRVDTKDIFKHAILSNACGVIVIHNHPSGELEPSSEDIQFTKKMIKVGRLLGIDVLDHVIISDNDHLSMKDTTTLWEL